MSEQSPEADWFPLEPAQHEAQRSRLLASPAPRRVLDLGCGDGRLLGPLHEAGHDVIGVDRDPVALARCAEHCHLPDDRLFELDFRRQPWPASLDGPFDLVLCLGNTFMLVHEPDDAADLLAAVAARLRPGGAFCIDALCDEMWREVAEGYWQEGVAEDGSMQLLWRPGDNVIALRHGHDVDPDHDAIAEADALFRLWTWGELRLLARLSGLIGPEQDIEGYLVRMIRPHPAESDPPVDPR
jgi:SAM-dependent methyltransferase